jgi:hypothetical protein
VARNKNKQQKQYKTLLSVLAEGSTDKALALLKKHSGEDARDIKELEAKLSRVWAVAPYKKEIEKEFAEIHPHKDFILKYIQPIVELSHLKAGDANPVSVNNDALVEKSVIVHDGYANASGHAPCGSPNCNHCKRYFSSLDGNKGCQCSSNASGETAIQSNPNNSIVILGMISIVAIVGVVMYLKSTK